MVLSGSTVTAYSMMIPPRGLGDRADDHVAGRLGSCPGSQAGAVDRAGAQLLLDPEQLVVLGDPVGARGAAGLDLAAVGGHGDVGDGGVLGLAGAVAEHGG